MKRKQLLKWAKLTLETEATLDYRRLNKDLCNWEFANVIEGLIKANFSDRSKRELINLFISNVILRCLNINYQLHRIRSI